MARIAVLVFPGSNCDHDVYHATKHVLGQVQFGRDFADGPKGGR